MMSTGLPLNTWGRRTHINEKYCSECAKIAQERGILPLF